MMSFMLQEDGQSLGAADVSGKSLEADQESEVSCIEWGIGRSAFVSTVDEKPYVFCPGCYLWRHPFPRRIRHRSMAVLRQSAGQ